MSDNDAVPAIADAAVPELNYTYASPAAARQALREDFYYWSRRITDTSFQLSLAVLAANWAVFGSATGILANNWSRYSIASVILCLVVNLLGARWMTRLHEKRYSYAEEDHPRWKREFVETAGSVNPWPYTEGIETGGRLLREVKTWLPMLGGALFLMAALG